MANNIKPTPADEQDRDAQAAAELQGNEFLARALNEIEEAYTREWKNTEGPHDDMRERAYYMVRAIDRLKSHIANYAVTRKINKQAVKETMQGK